MKVALDGRRAPTSSSPVTRASAGSRRLSTSTGACPGPVRALAARGARLLPESTERASRSSARCASSHSRRSTAGRGATSPGSRTSTRRLAPSCSRPMSSGASPRVAAAGAVPRGAASTAHRRATLVNRLSFVELQSFLPCNVLEYGDRMSMAHGLEVRAPYTDHRLVEHVLALPGSAKLKRGGRRRSCAQAPAPRLPERPVAKRKVGFNPPIGRLAATGSSRGLIDIAPLAGAGRGARAVPTRGRRRARRGAPWRPTRRLACRFGR